MIIRQAAYCKYNSPLASISFILYSECFQEVLYHKYRVNVFKTRSGETGTERVLVAMSTGLGSRLLLYLTQLTKIQDKNRRNMDTFIPVHIRETEEENTSELREFVEKMGLEYLEIPIDAVFSKSLTKETLHSNEANKAKFNEVLADTKSATVKSDIIRILRQNLLAKIAQLYECKRIYLGETNDRMAINVMANICAGRGATVPWTQLPLQKLVSCDNEVAIVRPLREAQAQEVPQYLKLAGIFPSKIPDAPPKDTIYGLTSAFISGLAIDYTATPSIVTRTAAKVMTDTTPIDPNAAHCKLCHCPILIEPSEDRCESCKSLIDLVPLLEPYLL